MLSVILMKSILLHKKNYNFYSDNFRLAFQIFENWINWTECTAGNLEYCACDMRGVAHFLRY